jgi:tetratricopeptide (TPR) repeat protein
VRDAHAATFRVLGEDCQCDYAVRGAEWLAQLVAEADNLRAALAWVDQTDDRETGLALALALGYLAMHRGGLAEPQHWISRFLDGDALPSPQRVHATVYEGVLTLFLGASADALTMAKSAEEIARAAGSDLDVGYARLIQAVALQDLEAWDEAVAGYTDAVVLCEHLVPTHGAVAAIVAAEAHNGLGAIAEIHHSDRDAAGRHYEAALHTAEAAGIDRTHRAVYLQNLAGIERERGHAARAATLLAEALPLAWEANDFRLVASGLEEVAWCAIAAGLHHQAARLLGAFRALFMRMGFAEEPILVAQREHFLRTVQKVLGPTAFAEAWAAGENLPIESAMSEALALTNTLLHSSVKDGGLD